MRFYCYIAGIIAIAFIATGSFAKNLDRNKYDQGKKDRQNRQSTYSDVIDQSTGTRKSGTDNSGSGNTSGGREVGNNCCKNGFDDFMGQGTCLDGSQPIYPCNGRGKK